MCSKLLGPAWRQQREGVAKGHPPTHSLHAGRPARPPAPVPRCSARAGSLGAPGAPSFSPAAAPPAAARTASRGSLGALRAPQGGGSGTSHFSRPGLPRGAALGSDQAARAPAGHPGSGPVRPASHKRGRQGEASGSHGCLLRGSLPTTVVRGWNAGLGSIGRTRDRSRACHTRSHSKKRKLSPPGLRFLHSSVSFQSAPSSETAHRCVRLRSSWRRPRGVLGSAWTSSCEKRTGAAGKK